MTKRKQKSEQMAIVMPSSMRRKIATLAKEQGKSQSEIVRETLRFLGVKPGELTRTVTRPTDVNAAARPPSALLESRTPLRGLENSTVPGRITINISGEMAARVNKLSALDGVSKNNVVLSALERSFVARASATAAVVANRADVLRYSRIIIVALQEALDYDAARQHNQPPPALRLDDPAYLGQLRDIIAELKRLNELLERPKPPVKISERAVAGLSKHLDTFLCSYSKSLGVGLAGLTVGAVAALLYKAGVSEEVVDAIWQHLPK